MSCCLKKSFAWQHNWFASQWKVSECVNWTRIDEEFATNFNELSIILDDKEEEEEKKTRVKLKQHWNPLSTSEMWWQKEIV